MRLKIAMQSCAPAAEDTFGLFVGCLNHCFVLLKHLEIFRKDSGLQIRSSYCIFLRTVTHTFQMPIFIPMTIRYLTGAFSTVVHLSWSWYLFWLICVQRSEELVVCHFNHRHTFAQFEGRVRIITAQCDLAILWTLLLSGRKQPTKLQAAIQSGLNEDNI